MKSFKFSSCLTHSFLCIIAFLFVFLFSCTTSPYYEHHPFWFHGDSGIFQEMGVCLAQGGTPYVDLFDHKGPILWFIQALGILISPKWGIMALQTIFLTFTIILWYKTASILTKRQIPSILVTFLGLFFLMAFYQRGNLCEEWSLPFISLPIYLYIRHCDKTLSYNHWDCFIIGLCVGILAMIRLNNTAPLIGFVVWHFVLCFKDKDYRRFWIDVALICGGIAVVAALCVLFYHMKAGWNGVTEMLYGTFVFNFIYFGDASQLSFFSRLQHYSIPAVFVVLAIVQWIRNKLTSNISIPCIVSIVVSLLAIGSFDFWHYAMILVPLFVVMTGISLQTSKLLDAGFIAVAIVFSCFIGYDAADVLLFRLRGKQADTELNDGFHRFVSSLPANERQSIYNAGLNHMGAGLFADENIYQCNRIIYKGHTDISQRLQSYEKTHGIKDIQPIWILTQSRTPILTDEYAKNHYTLTDSIPGGEFDPIWCWKKSSSNSFSAKKTLSNEQ